MEFVGKRFLIILLLLTGTTAAVQITYGQTPSITSFSPASGSIGSSVTISGTNFSPVPSENVVTFGATKGVVTAATSVSLQVTVPVGATYAQISVTTSGHTAMSAFPFTVTFAGNHLLDASSLAAKADISARDPYGVAIADLDGDGKSELIVTNQYDSSVSVYRNISTSGTLSSASFSAPVKFHVADLPRGVSVGDLDGDGKPEIVVANYNSSTISIFHNASSAGSISFESGVEFATDSGSGPFNIAIADLNGDGKPDLIVANDLENRVSVFQNTSAGSITSSSFAPKVNFQTSPNPSVQVGDIDGDGKPDIVVAEWGGNSVSVLRNTCVGGADIDLNSFAPEVSFTAGTHPFSISIADFDGDGKLDIAAPDEDGGSVSIFRNASSPGTVAMDARIDVTTGSGSRFSAAADINGDGKPDLAVTNRLSDNMSVLQNLSTLGTISFAEEVDFATGVKPRGIAIGDLDGDKRPDILVANEGVNYSPDNTISVFRNVIDTYTIDALTCTNGSIAPSGHVNVNYGESKTFVITPAYGYHADSVLVDGVLVDSLTSYTFDNITANHTIYAKFAINQYTITASSSGNGTISPAGVTLIPFGGSQAYTITPDAHYHVDSLFVDGAFIGTQTSYSFSNVIANHTIAVKFAVDTNPITASSGAHGTISPSGTLAVSYGGSQLFTMTPAAGYHVADVLVDDGSVGAVASYNFTNVTSAHSISVTFAIDTLTISSTAGNHGTVSPSGNSYVTYGGSLNVVITPSAGYHVDSVYVDGLSVDSLASYTFNNVTASHTLHATFAIDHYLISASAGTNGTISPTGSVDVTYGANQAFTVTSNTGYHIDSVLVDGVNQGAVGTYTFNNVIANHTISATFSINQFSITATSGANGTISPSGSVTVNYNANQSFTITPNAGYHIDSVLVDGVSQGSVGGYTFNNVTTNHTISATFSINQFTITATTGTNGAISPSGSVTVNYNANQSFSIAANSGYHIDSVLVDGVSQGAVGSYTFNNVTTNHTISATFSIDQFTITATAGTNGAISPSGSVTVNYNANQSFTITPNAGYHIDSVLVDGVSQGAVGSYTFNSVTTNHTISATFSINQFTITANAGANGTISPSGLVSVNYNANQSFTITANNGYHIDSVVVDGVSQGAVVSYTFNNVTTNHTVSATFSINQFTITATAGANGAMSPSGSVNASFGSNQSFTITPNTGYHIDSVIVDGVNQGAVASYTFNNITANHTISAAFSINQYTITASAGANGTMSPSGSLSVNYGANQSFTITPNNGYHIDSFLVDGVNQGAVENYTFNNVTANHTIRAAFAINQFTITASAGANGSISPSGLLNVNFGADQSFTITPNTGYHIDSVLIDGVSQGPIGTYTFNNVTANHSVRATFAINQYTIKSSAGTNGSISPSGTVSVTYGATQSFAISPNTGYHITDVLVDGVSVGAVQTYDFINVTANHTISASFAINQYSVTASAGAHGEIVPAGVTTANFGDSLAYTITPDAGYFISDVHVDTASVGPVSDYTFSNIHANHTITATFSIQTFTVKSSGGLHGTISPVGTTWVNYGDSLVFTMAPDSGYYISDVHVDTSSVGAVSKYTFLNIVKNHTIAAAFAQILNPVPVLNSIHPSAAFRSETLSVGFSGTGFINGVTGVNVDSGIILNSIVINTSDSLTANIAVRTSALLGSKNFSVSNSGPGGGTSGSKPFTVLNHLPASASLIAPGNHDTIFVDLNPSTVNFLWHSSPDADRQDTVRYLLSLWGAGLDTTLTGLSDTTLSWKVVHLLTVGSSYKWTVGSSDGYAAVASPDTFTFVVTTLTAVKGNADRIPKIFALHQNFPNPFNPSTTIRFDLPHEASVTLAVYNILGQQLSMLVDHRQMQAGYQEVRFDATSMPSGVYLYRISAVESGGKEFVSVKKMMLLK